MQDNHHVANRLSTGLIKTDGTSNPLSQSVITYEYDANDRLTKSTLQGPPPFVAMAKTADDLYAESSSRRSHHGMKAFALAALGTLCVPVLLMRSRHRPLGRRARRRRIVNSAMLVFMALLMAVGPENVQAAYLNSALYQSLVAAGLAQVSETITTYQYDAAGNLTEERRGTGDSFNSYAYDAENHLRSATIRLDGDSQGFRFLSYTYDADGIRTSKTVKIGSGDPATTWYVVDKNRDYAQVLEERDANGTLAVRYVYGLDLIAQVRGTNPSYYHYDGLGSTRQLTDNPTNPLTDKPDVLNSYTYEAFGRRLESGTGDQVDNSYRFTGEQYDGQTSSYYLRARYYQPGTGRFTGRDAFQGNTNDPMTLHKYMYCAADPVNKIDPGGEEFTIAGMVGTMKALSIRYIQTRLIKDAAVGALMNVVVNAAFDIGRNDFSGLSSYVTSALTGAFLGVVGGFTANMARNIALAITKKLGLQLFLKLVFSLGAYGLMSVADTMVVIAKYRSAHGKWPSWEDIGTILKVNLCLNLVFGWFPSSFLEVMHTKARGLLIELADQRVKGGYRSLLAQSSGSYREMERALARFSEKAPDIWPAAAINIFEEISTNTGQQVEFGDLAP